MFYCFYFSTLAYSFILPFWNFCEPFSYFMSVMCWLLYKVLYLKQYYFIGCSFLYFFFCYFVICFFPQFSIYFFYFFFCWFTSRIYIFFFQYQYIYCFLGYFSQFCFFYFVLYRNFFNINFFFSFVVFCFQFCFMSFSSFMSILSLGSPNNISSSCCLIQYSIFFYRSLLFVFRQSSCSQSFILLCIFAVNIVRSVIIVIFPFSLIALLIVSISAWSLVILFFISKILYSFSFHPTIISDFNIFSSSISVIYIVFSLLFVFFQL